MIKNYFKIAWRTIQNNKLYSFINITGLSIGLAVCMLITLFIKDEFSFDQFQEKKNSIYRLVVNETSPEGQINKFGITGMVHGAAFQEQLPELKSMVRFEGGKVNVKYKNEVFVQDANYVDSNFFDMFSASFIEGNAQKALSDPFHIVLSETVANRFFGTEKAVGKTLAIEKDGEFKDYTITAVTKNSPQNSSIQMSLMMPIDYKNDGDKHWINFHLNTFFTVAPDANIANIEKQMAAIYKTNAAIDLAQAKKDWKYNNQLAFSLQPFLEMHLSREYRAENGLKDSSNKTLSVVLSGMALFILLIACINFINISISHSLKRAKEIGVRKVMGGQRKQLIMQFMSESFLLNTGAFVLAIILTNLLLPVFNNFTSKSLAFSYLFDVKLIVLFLSIFLLTSFLAGFYPSLVISAYKPVQALSGKFRLSGKSVLLKTLIVFQFGLATFFIILAIIQYKQVNLFTTKYLGYDDRNMVLINTGGSKADKGTLFMNEIKKNKDVLAVAPRNFSGWMTNAFLDNGEEMEPDMNVVDENFLNTFGLKLKEGRAFSKDYPADSTLSIMVNEAFVKVAGWTNAIGQNVKVMNRDPYKVVGVIKDYHFSSLYQTVKPQIFTCNNHYGGYGSYYIKLSGNNVPEALDFVKATFKNVFPTKPFAYDFLSDINDKQYEKEFQMKQIVLWSAMIIIFISCMGLFGLSILTTEKRRKEIGVRKVLGASLSSIVQMLSFNFLKLVLLGFIIFAPLALYTGNNLLENYPYRINVGISIFGISLLALVLISIITVSYHALKAAIANPVKSLRTE
jgi:putative ABC transport system permease protein